METSKNQLQANLLTHTYEPILFYRHRHRNTGCARSTARQPGPRGRHERRGLPAQPPIEGRAIAAGMVAVLLSFIAVIAERNKKGYRPAKNKSGVCYLHLRHHHTAG